MFKNFFYIFTLFFFFNFSHAEIIEKIEITGNDRVSDSTIKVYGEIDLNQKNDLDQNDLNLIIKKLYDTDFFEDIQAIIENNILKIKVAEYKIINDLVIEGEKANKIKDFIKENIYSRPNASFIKNRVNNDINTIKEIYSTLGFNFTDIEADVVSIDDRRLNLIFSISKGNRTKISKINFIGEKKFKDRRLKDIIVSEEAKFWKVLTKNVYLNFENINLDKRLLTNYYKSSGYYDVQILSENAEIDKVNNSIEITYTINAGQRYIINKIETKVDPVLNKEIFLAMRGEYEELIGQYYSPFKIKRLLTSLDALIANQDLQFIEHSVSETIEDDKISIKINIFEGSKELIERIDIVGNTITEEGVIRGDLLVDEGDPMNNLKLSKSISRLKARNIFAKVNSKVSEGSSSSLKKVKISVEEKPTGEISAGAGVGTTGGLFGFNISENNWLGRGVKLSTSIQVDEESFRGGIDYANPNYNFSNNLLGFNISSEKTDKPDSGYENSIYSAGIRTRFEQYKDIYLSPSLNLSHDDLRVMDNASASLKKQAGSYTDLMFNYGLQSDKRDRAFQPTSGYSAFFGQGIPLFSDAAYLQNTLSFSNYTEITPNIIGAVKFFSTFVDGINEDVRLSKRVTLPSSKMRGFARNKIGPKDGNDHIGGNRAVALNIEAALPNFLPQASNTDIALFLDAGNVWGVDYDSSIDESNKLRSSFGLAASYLSPIGPLSFTFSQDLSKASTDSTESFNFSLGTTF